MSINPSAAAAPAPTPTPLEREQIVGNLEMNMEHNVEMFNKLSSTCFNKCVERHRYKEAELNLGETSCIDRCINKYVQVTNIIGNLLALGQPNA